MKKFLMLMLVGVSFGLLGADYAEAVVGCRCQAPAVAAQPAAPATTTAHAPQVRRSYSVEPGIAPAPTYVPMRRFRSQTPIWALPKSDLRKYRT